MVVVVNAPDTLTPDSHHDWTNHEIRFPTHVRFTEMVETGDVKAPTLHASDHGYTLDVPVDVPEQDGDTVDGRVLSVDLGVKKQATAVVLDTGEDGHHEQIAPPECIDHPAKNKLFRVKTDVEGINDRLAELRRQGKNHTGRFDHLLAEYRRTRRRERRLREQIQHDVANELVWRALDHGCETIVFESLGQLDTGDASGAVAWSISSWARGQLLDHVEYKAELVGIDFETTGFHPADAESTVAGLAHELGVPLVLNTGGRPASHDSRVDVLNHHGEIISLTVCDDEAALLSAFVADANRLDENAHYLTAFNIFEVESPSSRSD